MRGEYVVFRIREASICGGHVVGSVRGVVTGDNRPYRSHDNLYVQFGIHRSSSGTVLSALSIAIVLPSGMPLA
jgi:hypothetical protein